MDNINECNPCYGLKYYILENRKKYIQETEALPNITARPYHIATFSFLIMNPMIYFVLSPVGPFLIELFLSFECRGFVFLSFEDQKQRKQLGGGTFLARQNDDDEGDLERIKIHLANIWYVSSTLTPFNCSFKNRCSSVWLLRKLENRKIVFVRNFHLRMFTGLSWALKC